jgi:molecular chaperone GrpE
VKDSDISPLPIEGKIETDEFRESPLPIGGEIASPAADETDWRSLALHLQADIDNFRKRQTRRADESIAAEHERLLRLFLPVADNLTRALSHDGEGDPFLHQGVELTYRELMRRLETEGVTRIETGGRPFTPELHEAVATVAADAEAGTIVEELERGYMLKDRLLRPARVVVAA